MAKRENREKDDFDSYEPDAFDNPPKGPSGVHRGRRSAAARFMPFVIVVLVAALCGWGAWGYFSGEAGNIRMPWSSSSSDSSSSSSDDAAKQAAAKKKAKAKAAKEAAAKKKAEEEAAQQAAQEQADQEQAQQQEQAAQEQAAQPDKTKSVRVINGTRTSGYAASKKTVLDQAGYTNVVAANPQGSLPSATVVWYADAADQATAQDVANTLGISNVQQASGLSSSVVVVLLS
ncbi:LytR C-terminal domain-containing protein [Bifidobacterium saguinibicoloris]|uniref:LytR C-terminal domain-containing protein n=1 Tax=Bifidobacterium saguinibicoloris TaxID=2834433 RepID=UPI001C55EA05|nr:LytR C-terminal domain-containing protein [Bifidobacterium saguinibicoloris]MBW3080623.1 LytR C-terminal domain-containing protein [Bifidobacterium saguinibicoloris]